MWYRTTVTQIITSDTIVRATHLAGSALNFRLSLHVVLISLMDRCDFLPTVIYFTKITHESHMELPQTYFNAAKRRFMTVFL